MSFRDQLATQVFNYEEMQMRLLEAWRAQTIQALLIQCARASRSRKYECQVSVELPGDRRSDLHELGRLALPRILTELGFPDGAVRQEEIRKVGGQPIQVKVTLWWGPEDATGSIPEPNTQTPPATGSLPEPENSQTPPATGSLSEPENTQTPPATGSLPEPENTQTEPATGSIPEPQNTQTRPRSHTHESRRGTCKTCPICQEHRPAVVLVPCGHVICGDCSGQIHQCPFCRRAITSATDGLFMD